MSAKCMDKTTTIANDIVTTPHDVHMEHIKDDVYYE